MCKEKHELRLLLTCCGDLEFLNVLFFKLRFVHKADMVSDMVNFFLFAIHTQKINTINLI